MDDAGLYERDFYLWTQEQAARLRRFAARRPNVDLDLENLAEEIESVGRSELRGLAASIERIVEHLLKLEYSPARDPERQWRLSIVAARGNAEAELEMSPSLRARLDVAAAYRRARRLAAESVVQDGVPDDALPRECPYSLEQILAFDWYPSRRVPPAA